MDESTKEYKAGKHRYEIRKQERIAHKKAIQEQLEIEGFDPDELELDDIDPEAIDDAPTHDHAKEEHLHEDRAIIHEQIHLQGLEDSEEEIEPPLKKTRN